MNIKVDGIDYWGKKAYRIYLKTDHWKKVREATIVWYGGECARTGCPFNIDSCTMHIHHLQYENIWNETPGIDTELLCMVCHSAEHGFFGIQANKPIGKKKRKWKKKKSKVKKKRSFKEALREREKKRNELKRKRRKKRGY